MADRVAVFVIDPNFRRQLAAALWSVADTNATELDAVAVLTSSISRADRDRIVGPVDGLLPVEWFDVDESMVEGAQIVGPYPAATCFKLILAEILPPRWNRVLYLDSDVLVLDSVAPLFEVDLEEALVGAVRDARAPFLATAGVPWREMSVDPSLATFNAGVLVVPLSAWRDREVARRGLEILRRHRVPLVDQGALNALSAASWKRLPARFNAQNGHFFNRDASLVWAVEPVSAVEEAVEAPAIVHFNSGEPRPWEPGSVHPFSQHWLRALDHTDWAGWRPPPYGRFRRAAVEGRRRAARALRALRTG